MACAAELARRYEHFALKAGGGTVGRLAKTFEPPNGMRCIEAKVNAIVVWKKKWTDPKYADAVKSEKWEVVVPVLVFAPGT